jgi:hypothetical protein
MKPKVFINLFLAGIALMMIFAQIAAGAHL